MITISSQTPTSAYREPNQCNRPRIRSARATAARAYLDKGGAAVLDVLDQIAAARHTTVAAVALAWLRARPQVAAPIASARTTRQLEQILPAAMLELTPAETDRLSATTQPA
jgi:aryl-alcohol dehydrogenase (NADP+)